MRNLFVALSLFVAWSVTARAETFTILVAPRDTPAQAAAEKAADGKTTFYEAKLFKALTKAAELLQKKPNTVIVQVAESRDNGQSGAGTWTVPMIDSPTGKLLLLGGYAADWQSRDPFGTPTELITSEGRPVGVINFEKKTVLAEIVISGFVFDVAPSNKYDAKTNSILKGTSRSVPILQFSQAVTNHLVVADNVFLNGAHGAFDPYVSPASNDATIDIRNNFFINNIKMMKFAPAMYKGNTFKEVNFKQNSVLMNWPFNPDSASSNVGALELPNSDCCTQINIDGNLFAFNPGGAMQHDWEEKRMPKLSITNNLFYGNAVLFKDARPDAGFFVGKFGKNPKYLIITAASAQDDYGYTISGNVSMDPKVPLALVDIGVADSSSVEAKKTAMNDMRGLFGMNKDGGTVAISNYAPRVGLDPKKLPFPAEPKAEPFGVHKAGLFKPAM